MRLIDTCRDSGGYRAGRHLARMIDKNSKRMGAARFGHRTPARAAAPSCSRAPRGGANDEAQVSRARPETFGPS
jgi:hypothetical protein